MGLWRTIVDGFGLGVGSQLAKKAFDELTQEEADEEAKAKALASRNRKIAVGVVIVSGIALLLLSGALTAIVKWLLIAGFSVSLLGGVWMLLRKRWYTFKAKREEARATKKVEKVEVAKKKSVEEQLAELKARRGTGEREGS